MLRKLLKYYKKKRDWKHIVWDEETDFQVPFYERAKYALKGFSANECIWYNLKHNDYQQYISEFKRMASREINGAYKFILDDKLVFEEVLSNYTRVPINYAWIKDGVIYGLHDFVVDNETIIEFLHQVGKSVYKYLGLGGGVGTYVFESIDVGIQVNGKIVLDEKVKELFARKGQSILCEYISQSEFAASLYPCTTNTIRIVCAKEKGKKEARIIAAVQRIGRKCSIPVDNVHSGGLVSEINLSTGELSVGIAGLGEMSGRLIPYNVHPDGGGRIQGCVIPEWKILCHEITALTNKLPYMNFVAWDVLLTSEGFCIIEGNASSSCNLFQMKHGIKNSDFGDVLRSYGITK